MADTSTNPSPTPSYKTIANIITTYLKPLSEHKSLPIDSIASPDQIIALAQFFDEKKINSQGLQKALDILAAQPDNKLDDIEQLLEDNNLLQLTDDSLLRSIVHQIINENSGPVADYKGGKEQSIGFLIGQCMKASKGSGNPQIFKALLTTELNVS